MTFPVLSVISPLTLVHSSTCFSYISKLPSLNTGTGISAIMTIPVLSVISPFSHALTLTLNFTRPFSLALIHSSLFTRPHFHCPFSPTYFHCPFSPTHVALTFLLSLVLSTPRRLSLFLRAYADDRFMCRLIEKPRFLLPIVKLDLQHKTVRAASGTTPELHQATRR